MGAAFFLAGAFALVATVGYAAEWTALGVTANVFALVAALGVLTMICVRLLAPYAAISIGGLLLLGLRSLRRLLAGAPLTWRLGLGQLLRHPMAAAGQA